VFGDPDGGSEYGLQKDLQALAGEIEVLQHGADRDGQF